MRKKYNRKHSEKRKLKITLLVVEIIVILLLVFAVIMVFLPNSKMKLIKSVTSCAPGRSIISLFLGGDYEKYLQDSGFDSGNINQNKDLKINTKYTNIALFGTDSRSGDLTESSHTDSIIIVSMNNKTGEVKMVSIFRDTILEFVVDGKIYYDKATNAFSYGNAETVINMLNANLDLNIKDYAIVNFAGLANIIDALGGLDVTITEDERIWTNNYLGETRNVTGMTKVPNVTKSGNVHFLGLQATAYARIRYVPFYFEDGTSLNNDYGRAARQRYVLEKIVEKGKTAGVNELLNISKELFKENTGEDQFLATSLDFDEILDLIPAAIEFNLAGSEGFPFDLESGSYSAIVVDKGKQKNLYSAPSSSVFAKGLENNVKKLHEFLFDETDYEPTKNVKEINDILIDITGSKPVTKEVE